MPFKTVERNPVYLQVAEQIRKSIYAGHLAPGEALPTERELAEEFGVSRATVREALRALQAQGLVSGGGRTSPLRTTVATDAGAGSLRDALTHMLNLRPIALRDLVELRSAIESSALEQTAREPDAEALESARSALAAMRAPGVDVEAFHDLDVQFHIALVEAFGNAAMHGIMIAIRESMADHLLEALNRLQDPESVLRRLTAEHQAILDAVDAADSPRAAALVRAHIRNFYREDTATEARR